MKKAFCFIALILLIFAFVSLGFLKLWREARTVQPPYPETWNKIAVGMTIDGIIKIIDPPTYDMSGLKTIDTWKLKLDGTEMILLVQFDRNNESGQIATHMFRHKKRNDNIYDKERYPWK